MWTATYADKITEESTSCSSQFCIWLSRFAVQQHCCFNSLVFINVSTGCCKVSFNPVWRTVKSSQNWTHGNKVGRPFPELSVFDFDLLTLLRLSAVCVRGFPPGASFWLWSQQLSGRLGVDEIAFRLQYPSCTWSTGQWAGEGQSSQAVHFHWQWPFAAFVLLLLLLPLASVSE